MSFCTTDDVRMSNQKLANTTDIPETNLEDQISMADNTIIVDLSGIKTADELNVLTDNQVLRLLSIYKTIELTLASFYGAARNVDQITDIQFWQKKYNDLIKKVIDGGIVLDVNTLYNEAPVITSSMYRKKLFPKKGIDGFEEGSVDDREVT